MTLRKYRFFQDFQWNEDHCKLFARYNIVYGWNGSGKTTLCDFLRELEIGKLSEPETRVSLLFQDAISKDIIKISQAKLTTAPYIFHVYHNKYIRDNIPGVDSMRHIYAIGAEQIKNSKKLEALEKKLPDEESLYTALQTEVTSAEQSFDTLKIRTASTIKNACKYSMAYNKNKFYTRYQELVPCATLSDIEYQQACDAIRAEKREDIHLPTYDFIRPSVREVIVGIMKESPINITIAALADDDALNDWAERGLFLHEKAATATCLFCGGDISTLRLNALKAHFNTSYKELSRKIDDTIRVLMEKAHQFEEAVAATPSSALFYAELRDAVNDCTKNIKQLVIQNRDAISRIVGILKEKKSNMIDDSFVELFEAAMLEMNFDYSCFAELNSLVAKHNEKTKEFQRSINAAQEQVERHMISEVVLEMRNSEDELRKKTNAAQAQ